MALASAGARSGPAGGVFPARVAMATRDELM